MRIPPLMSVVALSIAPLTTLAAAPSPPIPPPIPPAPYAWISVAMGGGGAVAGIVVHPQVADLSYIHTDVGGAYRWDGARQSWIPLLESLPFSEWNLYGVDSIAVDPSDATGNTVYIATGKYTAGWAKPLGVVMKSVDRGATWARTSVPSGGSNGDQGCGERLAVDPHNGRHVVYASRMSGLYSSMDAGKTWEQVAGAPTGGSPDDADKRKRGEGLTFAIFDASSGVVGDPPCTRVFYVGASRDGVYQTGDGGKTWSRMEGSPENQRKAAMGSDGTLLVSHGGLAKFVKAGDGWSEIVPPRKEGGGVCAIAIDPENPQHILANRGDGHHCPIFRSVDGGKSWTDVTGERNGTVAWWPGHHWLSNPFSMAFDPFHKNQVWLTDWYGTYRTPDVTAAKPVWTNLVAGIEETVVVGALVAPAGGKYRLLSGIADIGGLDHESLTEAPSVDIWKKGLPLGMTRTGIAVERGDPSFIVTVGIRDWNGECYAGYSLDGGTSYKTFASYPKDAKGGRVVLAGSGRRIVWAPQDKAVYYSDDLGGTWTRSRGAADASLNEVAHGSGIFVYDQPLAVDMADGKRVYALQGKSLFVSTDGGAVFSAACGNLPGDRGHKIATSGKALDVWVAEGSKGLHRSVDGGKTFAAMGVDTADLFCFGKAPAGKSFPAVFVKGSVQREAGYFRSDDQGVTWMRIDMPEQRIGDDPNTMTGDWRVFGGVFVGTNGRGIYWGCPRETK